MLVRHRHPDLGDLRVGLEHSLAHGVQGLLQGQAVLAGERLEQDAPHVSVALGPVEVGARVPPAGGDRGGQDAVRGLGQGGVAIAREPGELRYRRLQHHQVGKPRQPPGPRAGDGDDRGPGAAPGAGERVPVLGAVHHDPVPGVLLDADLRAGHPLEGGREVPAQAQRELLDLAHPVLLGEGVDGVLLGVGGHDLGVVAPQVRVGEVAAQRGRHVQVLDLVPVTVAGHVHQADLRLAVLVVTEGDGHAQLPSCCPESCCPESCCPESCRPESWATSLSSAEWSNPPAPCSFSAAARCATSAPSGITTPASRAAAVTMPMSLSCSAMRKPGVKSRASIAAPLRCSTVLPASPPPRTRSAASVSTPWASRNTIASATSSMMPATMSWFAALTVCPDPAGPTWTTVLPTALNTGAAASKSAAPPPTMIESAPSIAACSPPDTGASSTRYPCPAPSAASSAATSGRMEEKSMISAPAGACSKTPPWPVSTARTSGESGTIVATTPASRTAPAMSAAPRPPAAANCSVLAGLRL